MTPNLAKRTWHRPLAVLLALHCGLLPAGRIGEDAVAASDGAVQPLRIDRDDFDLGLEVALAVAHEIGLVEDEAAIARLYNLGSRVAFAANDPSTITTFYIVSMKEPNAFAVPGGFIFITQGLLDLEISDDALAHLLGHEITHVRNRHHDRMGTWDAISSLVQTALLIGLTIGARGAGSATRTVDEYGNERVSLGGRSAIIEGGAVFGSVFRELFLRGFSRKLETEADEVGSRLATRAGFSSDGGVELLETLHRGIFEQAGYGYWRTHPYFVERVSAARARAGQTVSAPDSTAVAAYRLRVQATLAREASKREDGGGPAQVGSDPRSARRMATRGEGVADLIYRAAVRSGPGIGGAASVELQLVRFRAARERAKPAVQQRLGPIAAAADSAIARLEAQGSVEAPGSGGGPDFDALRAERVRLARELESNLGEAIRLLDTPGAASNAALDLFLVNYPDHPRAGSVRLALARRHLRQGQPDVAAPLLTVLAARTPADSLQESGRAELVRAVDQLTDPSVCYAVLDAAPDSTAAAHARTRMQTLIADLDSLEVGGRFLKRWPDSPYTAEVEARVGTLAGDTARFARVYEAGGKPQQALDLYNRVVLLAPGTEAAVEAMRGIERIQRLEES